MEKTCVVCGSKYEGATTSRYCSNACYDKAYRMRYRKGLPQFKDLKECPLLKQCEQASGINCEGKDFKKCDLFLRLLTEKRVRVKP